MVKSDVRANQNATLTVNKYRVFTILYKGPKVYIVTLFIVLIQVLILTWWYLHKQLYIMMQWLQPVHF